MMNFNFVNKKVIIFGLGSYKYGSGISAAKFFIKYGARVLLTDKKTEKDLKEQVSEIKNFVKRIRLALPKLQRDEQALPINISMPVFVLGKHRKEDFQNSDIVIRNPSVRADHPLLKLARSSGAAIHTDVSLFLKLLPATSYQLQPKVIGITGTRGKSTTSALLAKILKEAGKTVFLGGNLGYSPLNFIDKVIYLTSSVRRRRDTTGGVKPVYVVLEMSSWMTESLSPWKISPPYALVTNIYPDHLNTYDSMQDYIKAKAIIFKYQKSDDVLVLNQDNKITRDLAKRAKSKVMLFSKLNLAKLLRRNLNNLLGEHNKENIAAALMMTKVLGVSKMDALKAVRKFKGLAGRLEFVREVRGVKFYNDTTSTMPKATIVALRALHQSDIRYSKFNIPKIILIAGGMDKKLNYKELVREIPKHVKALILFKGEASDKLNSEFRIQNLEFRYFFGIDNMKEAVRLAWKNAKRGDIILLSPAAASFNMFRNEFDRGEQYVRMVKNLK